MKCSVCGNEMQPNSTRCSVCGTINDNDTAKALSNISAFANALKANRKINNDEKAYDVDAKKVSTKDVDFDDLYSKDINLEPSEEDVDEDFDLNAFYESAKEREILDAKTKVEKAPVSQNNNQKQVVSSTKEVKFVQDDSDNIPNDNKDEIDEQSVELEMDDSSQQDIVDADNESEDSIQFDMEESDESSAEEMSSDEDNSSDQDELSSEDDTTGSSDDHLSINFDEEDDETTNENLGYLKPNELSNSDVEDSNGVSIQYNEEVNTDNAQTDEPQEDFSAVKAEDVPFTELEEKANSNVSDSNPIVIPDKDVVGVDAKNNTAHAEPKTKEKKKHEKEKVKYNKVCGVISIILIVLAALVCAAIAFTKYLIPLFDSTNVVFDYLTEFISNPNNVIMCIIGSVGATVLALILSIMQTLIKPRRFGKVMVILSLLFVIGLCVAFYFMGYWPTLQEFFNTLFNK